MTNRTPNELPRFERGHVLAAAELNRIVDAITRKIVVGPGLTLTSMAGGVALGLSAPPPLAGIRVGARAVLTAEDAGGDFLEANLIDNDGSVLGAIKVARPADLQVSFWSGKTIDGVTYTAVTNSSRTGNDGSAETISPAYVVGTSILTVVRLPLGTGVLDGTTPVLYQDVTPRIWQGAATVERIRAYWETQSSVTLSPPGTENLDFQSGTPEIYNQGAGFEMQANNHVKILAPAAGQLIRVAFQARADIDDSTATPHIIAAVKDPSVSITSGDLFAGIAYTGVDGSVSGGGVSGHSHYTYDAHAGDQRIMLSAVGYGVLALNDELRFEVYQNNSFLRDMTARGKLWIEALGTVT